MAVRLGDPALAASAKAAYVHGMAVVLYTTAAIAAFSALLTAVLLPGRPTGRAAGEPDAAPEPATSTG